MKAKLNGTLLLAVILGVTSVRAATLYVDAASTNALPPYTNWLTAAAVIQDAVDAAAPGDEVVVTNGVYSSGGRALAAYPLMTNRVCVDRAITLRSVNGPEVTLVEGHQVPPYLRGDGAIRCAYLTNGAVLSGFTLTNGATRHAADHYLEQCGAGVLCASNSALVTNCILTGNWAEAYGSGACFGVLNNCTLTGNYANFGGGVYDATLNSCTLIGNWGVWDGGGGAALGTLNKCILASNNVYTYGGGAHGSTLNNCTLIGNTGGGGGAYHGVLNNCMVVGNSSQGPGGGARYGVLNNCIVVGNSSRDLGGGVYEGFLQNCIVLYNTASFAPNHYGSWFQYSCTTPLPTGAGNLDQEPGFVDTNGWSNLRLQSNSPCIDAGSNEYAWTDTDMDGQPRIVGGRVDIGAYENQNDFTNWLAQFSFPTDGTAAFADADADGLNNYQEYRCGTDPTNGLSLLRLLPPTAAGTNLILTWSSVTNRTYRLVWRTNLVTSWFFELATNLPGQPGTTSFTITNAAASAPCFYRVAVP